jgi:hypothetical protein
MSRAGITVTTGSGTINVAGFTATYAGSINLTKTGSITLPGANDEFLQAMFTNVAVSVGRITFSVGTADASNNYSIGV